ncbi:hypothetical protein AB990_20450 [Alkalihalobacillus pseudalcaliphilus]|nr:hypothetical protein AB990_20450 [Alkalihalobacillus pseudalcaliphilus]
MKRENQGVNAVQIKSEAIKIETEHSIPSKCSEQIAKCWVKPIKNKYSNFLSSVFISKRTNSLIYFLIFLFIVRAAVFSSEKEPNDVEHFFVSTLFF